MRESYSQSPLSHLKRRNCFFSYCSQKEEEKMTPLVSTLCEGPLGVAHLPRFW